MKKFWEMIEKATNIAVIVSICLAALFFYKTYRSGQSQGPKIGSILPVPAGYDWQSNSQTLVLVLRKGCHFCEDSMPFYRRLYGLEKNGAMKANMVAIFPDSAQDAYGILNAQKLPIPSVSEFNLSSLSVSGTPTLILVDRDGKVEKAWVGELDSAGQAGVLSAVEPSSR